MPARHPNWRTFVDRIENRTYGEIKLGDSASLTRTLTSKDIALFAVLTGDVNPTQVDDEYVKNDMFHKVIAHGMWGGVLISTVLGTELPGLGTVYLDQSLSFRHPVELGDTVTVVVKVVEKIDQGHRVVLDCSITNQRGEAVIAGRADVIAPLQKVSRPRVVLPEIALRDKGRGYRRLVAMTRGMAPLRTAVVHPVDAASLVGAVEAARAHLIIPVLVGPEVKIRAAAAQAGIDLAAFEIVGADHSDASAAKAGA